MSLEITEYDNITREDKILRFIRENRNCTKTEVVNYMDKNGASPMTTHKILKTLTNGRSKKVIAQTDNTNSRIHHLIINEKNVFNQIYLEVSEIEEIMGAMYQSVHKIWHPPYGTHDSALFDVYIDFALAYRDTINMMLEVLLMKIDNAVHSDSDSQLLFIKIVKLMLELFLTLHQTTKLREFLNAKLSKLNLVKRQLSEIYADKNIINLKILDNLIKKGENFEKQFLPS